MKATSRTLRTLLAAPCDEDVSELGEWRYHLELPNVADHRNHFTSEHSEVCSWYYVHNFLAYDIVYTLSHLSLSLSITRWIRHKRQLGSCNFHHTVTHPCNFFVVLVSSGNANGFSWAWLSNKGMVVKNTLFSSLMCQYREHGTKYFESYY